MAGKTKWIGKRLARPGIATPAGIRQAFPIHHLNWDHKAIKGLTYVVTGWGPHKFVVESDWQSVFTSFFTSSWQVQVQGDPKCGTSEEVPTGWGWQGEVGRGGTGLVQGCGGFPYMIPVVSSPGGAEVETGSGVV